MTGENRVVGDRTLESQVVEMVKGQLGQKLDSSERSRIYAILENLLQRDSDLERAGLEKELQLDMRAREDRRHSARQAVVSMLSLSVIVFTAGVTLTLKGSQDIGLFLLGCTAAFLREALVSYR